LVSLNPIFKDLDGATFKGSADSADALADGILNALKEIQSNSDETTAIASKADDWRQQHDYSILGARLDNICNALVHQY